MPATTLQDRAFTCVGAQGLSRFAAQSMLSGGLVSTQNTQGIPAAPCNPQPACLPTNSSTPGSHTLSIQASLQPPPDLSMLHTGLRPSHANAANMHMCTLQQSAFQL